MSPRTRTWPSLLAAASLVLLATGSANAATRTTESAADAPEGAEATPEAAPEGSAVSPAEGPAPTEAAEAVAPPPGDAPAATPPAEEPVSPTAVPAPPPNGATTAPIAAPTDPAAAPGREGTDPASPGDPADSGAAVSPILLESDSDSDESSPARTPPARRTAVQDEGAQAAAIAAAFDSRYRPEDNPGRLNVAGRVLFANAGGDGDVGGRMGGAQVDVGQAWNRGGYALTASAWGGRILLDDRVSEMNAIFGIGPSVHLGRTALQQRGLIDFRIGYDFMYSVVNQRSENTILATDPDSEVQLAIAENLIPHGPRAQLQLGLVSPGNHRKYFHGFGVVMGYQGLVGSLRGELPFTHMLVTGLSWWMG